MAGRPPFKPTTAMRQKVAAGAATGMTQDEIALALGITRPTLAKHFEVELTRGAAVKRLEARAALFAQVKKGHVAAIKAWLLLSEASAPAHPTAPGAPVGAPPAAPAAKLGKKEAAQIAAKGAAAGTEWEGILPSSNTVQ